MAVLLFPKAPNWQDCYTLEADITIIGRDESCDIVLGDGSVSRQHAKIERRGNDFWVEDLGSKNGTLVDGQAITRRLLADGERVWFGAVVAQFVTQPVEEVALNPSVSEDTYLFAPDQLAPESPRLRFLYDLAALVAQQTDQRTVIHEALTIIGRETEAENVCLGLVDGETVRQAFYQSFPESDRPFVLSRTILRKAIRSGKALLLRNAALDRELQDKSSVADTQTKSVMCLPVLTAGRTLGVLYADTRSLVRPFTREHLAFAGAVAAVLGSLLQQLRTIDELQEANRALHRRLEGDDLIGASPRMIETRETLQRFAKGQAPVLITGEPGTGKELAAQRLHRLSPRAAKPLIKVSCADFPKDLIESELFGHVRGGFTSSTGDRLGLFRLADGGTLLLDEIAELPLPLQSKLLRVLESGEIRPVGSDKVHKVDVRIITATNRDLRAMMTRGEFRQDLYDRIKVLRVELPRLADHKEDIPELCAYFLANLRGEFATLVECFSPDALARLQAYTWPGNVRELRSVVIRALYNCEETTILPEHLSGLDEPETVDVDEAELPSVDGPLNREMETLEKARIRAALEKHRWNRSRAAAELGIARKTLLAKVKKYNL